MADPTTQEAPDPRQVFVVHGRNVAATSAMFTFLRAIDLRPIEWDQAIAWTGEGSPFIGQVLDVAFRRGTAVVVLLTPDEIAYLQPAYAHGDDDPETAPAAQARPNVLFEAGMALGRDARRAILVELGDLRSFSDVSGRHAIRMDNSPQPRQALAGRLRTAGCAVNTDGSDWLTAGDFTPPPPPGGGLPLGRRVPPTQRRGASVLAAWHTQGSSKLDLLKITNNGAAQILDVWIEVPPELVDHVRLQLEAPLPKLPPGGSMTVYAWTTNKSMGSQGPAQFELTVTGRLDDGQPFQQEIFLDTVG